MKGGELARSASDGGFIDKRYPDDLSSIPRATQAAWLQRPSTPLVLGEVFNRRKNLISSDLSVLLVTTDKAERLHMKKELDGLGYKTTVATSGKSAMEMLAGRGGEFHVVLTSVGLSAENKSGEGPDCAGLLAWSRDRSELKEVAMIVLGSYSIEAAHTIELIRCGAIDVFTKPVPVETLHRLRNLVGTTQSLQQQRYASRGEGGARLVTSYLLRKEREVPTPLRGSHTAANLFFMLSTRWRKLSPEITFESPAHRLPTRWDCRSMYSSTRAMRAQLRR